MYIESKRIELDSRWFSPERDVSRTVGLHLSHIIDYIEWQEEKREKPTGELSKSGHAYAASGFLWERVLERLIEHEPAELWEWLYGRVLADVANPKIIRPGEQTLDAGECPCNRTSAACVYCRGTGRLSIYMTPDGFNIEDLDDDGLNICEEWKWTTKSSNNDIRGPKFRRWTQFQIPAYLKVLLLRTCRLRVYHARGDWRSPEPVWMEHLLHYSQEELDETWDMIVCNAQAMLRERALT